MRYSQDASDGPALASALRMVESILNKTNEAIREREMRERLRAISESLYVGNAAVSQLVGCVQLKVHLLMLLHTSSAS